MQVAYGNVYLDYQLIINGSSTHISQFIEKSTSSGHDIWVWPWPSCTHPLVKLLPDGRIPRFLKLRNMDVIYTRIEWDAPELFLKWGSGSLKKLLGNPKVVWEFNSVPEYGQVLGHSIDEINHAKELFRNYSQDCDLAVCVSKSLETYVQENFQIKRTIAVSNGSNPDTFFPGHEGNQRMEYFHDGLNVVWIGSAELLWHDLSYIIFAAKYFWDRSKKVYFHVIGRGFREITNMPPNVYYYGPVVYSKLPCWLADMDVGLVLHHPGPADFCSPIKTFDYMSSGLAVIGTPNPQLVEILREAKQEELIFPYGDTDALIKLLQTMIDNPDKLKEIKHKNRQLVIEKYNWKHLIQSIFEQIEQIPGAN